MILPYILCSLLTVQGSVCLERKLPISVTAHLTSNDVFFVHCKLLLVHFFVPVRMGRLIQGRTLGVQ